MPVGSGGAWRTTSRRTTTQSTSGAAGLEGTGGSGGPGCDARGRRRGPDKSRMQFKNTSDVTLQTDTNQHDTRGELHAKLRNDGHLSATTRRQRGGRQRTAGVAAVPVADGRAWPDNESTRRAKLAARTAGGPPPTSTPSSPAPRATPRAGRPTRAHQAARPHNRVLHRPEHQRRHQHRQNTSGATHHRGIAKPPSPAGAGRLNQYQRIIEESRQYRDYRDRFPGVRSRYRASRRCPWRCLPSGDPRRRR